MKAALIGYTGFVGSNIVRVQDFDDLYNSSNIADIRGKQYDLVVSAANRADMWRINQDGAGDLQEINEFIDNLSTVVTKKLVLISTVGVYASPNGADEDTPIVLDGLSPYGTNRYHLEQFCADNFDTTIVRLPGLFGSGLKKNVIFDLLHNNMVEKIHSAGTYQYYNLSNIWKDIEIALTNNLSLVNFATEPVKTSEVAEVCFGIKNFDQAPADTKPAFWDMHSKHADLFGGTVPYLYDKSQTLAAISEFVHQEQAK